MRARENPACHGPIARRGAGLGVASYRNLMTGFGEPAAMAQEKTGQPNKN